MLLDFVVRPRTPSPIGKKIKEIIFQSYENGLGAKIVKPEVYEALYKALTKSLLILRSENVLVNGPLLKEQTLEFAYDLNIESFRASERRLQKFKNKCI